MRHINGDSVADALMTNIDNLTKYPRDGYRTVLPNDARSHNGANKHIHLRRKRL